MNNQWFVKILRGGDNLRAVIGEQERGIELIKNQCISEKIGGGDIRAVLIGTSFSTRINAFSRLKS